MESVFCVKHLNPRKGITTTDVMVRRPIANICVRVKHLNPRKGITTSRRAFVGDDGYRVSVKHLNPRKGITTRWWGNYDFAWHYVCETPKSPQGDYNSNGVRCNQAMNVTGV